MASETGDVEEVFDVDPEYKKWKKNAPFLYDSLLTHSLEWPSLTAQWLPVTTKPEGKDYSVHRVILGTHTSNEQQNHLLIASVRLPSDDILFDDSQFDTDRGEYGGHGALIGGKIEVDVKINHQGEVNRARYAPQYPCLIATKSASSDVFVFDFTRHPSKPDSAGACKPELTLKGHEQEGFGLAWSPFSAGHLVSAGYDHRICFWDISATTCESCVVNAQTTYIAHTDKVGDVAWHEMHQNIFGSVSDDRLMFLWDTRVSGQPGAKFCGHSAEVNSISFNPFNEYLAATGSSDGTTGIWDLRQSKQMFHSINSQEVFQVQWSPHSEELLATSCTNTVKIWSIDKIYDQISQEELNFGPPELTFCHAGHCEAVSEFSWNLNEDSLMCSVSEDNRFHVWQPSRNTDNQPK